MERHRPPYLVHMTCWTDNLADIWFTSRATACIRCDLGSVQVGLSMGRSTLGPVKYENVHRPFWIDDSCSWICCCLDRWSKYSTFTYFGTYCSLYSMFCYKQSCLCGSHRALWIGNDVLRALSQLTLHIARETANVTIIPIAADKAELMICLFYCTACFHSEWAGS